MLSAIIFIVAASRSVLGADLPKPLDKVATVDALRAAVKNTKAKVILLNMWGIACSPCIAEMPLLSHESEKFKSDPNVAFLGLCIPEDGTATKKILDDAATIVQKRQVTYQNLIWTGTGDALLERFKIDGTPYTVLLTSDGKDIEEVKIPLDPAKAVETLEKSIASALAKVNGAK